MTDRNRDMIWLGDADGEVSGELVGSKAAGIRLMAGLGLRVPPAFVLPTTLCAAANADPGRAAAATAAAVRAGLERLESETGRKLGDSRAPLLVSVRSGAPVSMPGMLATVLDVGLTPESVQGLIRLSGDPRFAWDCYRRFAESYATVVGELPQDLFDRRMSDMIRAEGVGEASELDGEALERLALGFVELAGRGAGGRIPDEPVDQLTRAALAVFRSWEGRRAREYRRLKGLEGLRGTAVLVQAMVYGNSGRRSGAGVAFSRNPATGERGLYVDFVLDAQGEDVVSGRRTPLDTERLRARLPAAFAELERGAALLEAEARDVQDIEFTIEGGELYFLQTRTAQRTPQALLRNAVDLVAEGVIDPATALDRVAQIDLERVAVTRFATSAEPVAHATIAAPGVASGRAAFDAGRAKAIAAGGDPVILVRHEPATDDVEGFAVAAGILTAVGGRTAHAAVVARQLAKACLVGCGELEIADGGEEAVIAGHRLREGDWISIDGESGEVSLGRREIATQRPDAELAAIARWRQAGAGICSDAPTRRSAAAMAEADPDRS